MEARIGDGERMNDETVLGVDWYRRGWAAVALTATEPPRTLIADDLEALIARLPGAACVAVDMPIGLPQTERAADALARKFVGPRWQSVFATPPAEVLAAATYAEANAVAAALLNGKKISQQSWALRRNITRVSDVAASDPRIIEVHPEVSFRELIGHPVAFSKTTWNGQAIRRRALAAAGIDLPDDIAEAGAVPVADVLDAAVAAWSARRYAQGQAQSLPEGAQRGERQVIWY
jgi:predicted RNase H-like nuclease